ncbi:TPA: isoleucine--tRNA ligase [bacterium]|nr:isoleucine--tRNA ligase [bacterium]
MEIKDTLLMPKTAFEMRGNLPKKEPLIQKKWKEMDLYHKVLEKNKDKKPFVLHDGPPYANGDIHVGTAFNKVLKDFVVRYKSMAGFYSPYIPGWDTHGLPIETSLTKKGVNRKAMSTVEFRKKCEEYALKQVEKQKQQFLRLGTLSDFEKYYKTLDKDFEAMQIRVFAKMALDGLIYKGLKPVYWSPSSESALAEAEIEYKDVTSDSIYVAFDVLDGKDVLQGDEKFIIWTTTPWTIPANLAICLNPSLEYGVYETDKGVFVFLDSLKEELSELLELNILKVRKVLLGSEFEYVTTKHPLYRRGSLVILGDHVTAETGTGCVHTAPGHGDEDFIVGQKYGLEVLCPVDEKGYMTSEAGEEFAGLFYEECNKKIVEELKESGALLRSDAITHSYPHDWRTKKPVIFRATDQWFASIDKIRDQLLEEIKNVTWYPKWGEIRLHNMIKDRGDWCISRQRVWGVPIPIIYNEDKTPIMEEEVFEHIASLFEKHGSNIWFELDEKDLLPEGYQNENSPNGKFVKETDTMDVWFDSGSSHTGVLFPNKLDYPADLYLEGSDQYRGWFNSSLTIGTAYHGKSPYKAVVTHGFVLDGKGNKMSKSMGNVVDPNKVCSQYGAEILRLTFANVDYQADVRIGDDLFKQISESYRKIRNTFRFMLGNIKHQKVPFNYEKDRVAEFELVDKFILAKLNKVIKDSLEFYDDYNFASAVQTVLTFLTNDLSSFYLDFAKDILYCDPYNSLRRKQVLTVIYQCFDALMRILAPILPHTMDELYSFFKEDEGSVHLLDMPTYEEIDEKVLDEYEKLKELRDDVLKALETARASGQIGSSQEATVNLFVKDEQVREIYNRLSSLEKNRFFIVSNVVDEANSEGLEEFDVSFIKVNVNEGIRCDRCWNRYEEKEVNEEKICHRCLEAIKEYEEATK